MSGSKLASLVLAAIYFIVALAYGGAELAFEVSLFLILPLACIWFSDAMGGYTGPVWRAVINAPSPGVVVGVAGWLLLLLPAIVGIVYGLTSSER